PAFRRVTELDVFAGTQMPPSYNRVWIEVLTSARSMPATRNWTKVISETERTWLRCGAGSSRPWRAATTSNRRWIRRWPRPVAG
ncbi:MAG: hypothetical protein C4289_02715, partial [Chloroflexota bacterium]